MKTSNKILLISGSSLIGVVIIFLLIFRLTLGNSITTERLKDSDKSTVSKEFLFDRFTAIEVSGQWEIELTCGDTTQVKIKAPGDVMNDLSVKKRAGTLIISTDKKWRHNKRKITALITMPSLSNIRLKGLVSLKLNGFTSENLTLYSSGSTSIKGKENHIQHLNFVGKGVSNLNLKRNSVINADLNCKGVYKIELSMAGGELSGKLKGAGEVIYNGEVSKESIRTDGTGKVRREDET